MYKVTEFGLDYVSEERNISTETEFSANEVVEIFEEVLGNVYEVHGKEYSGNELPVELRASVLQLDGFIEETK
jgi:hypothetical protein